MNIITPEEVQQFRAETNGTVNKIHFNNAGASFPANIVLETIIDYLQEEAINGGYETEAKYTQQLANTYSNIARLLNAGTDEIVLVENASTAWGIAFNGITFGPGDEIITSELEYSTNVIGFLNAKKLHGVVIKLIPNDQYGDFDMAAFEKAISIKTKLIAITHIASTTGGMAPIIEIGKIALKHNILYLVDACQSVGQFPLDVKEIGCDMLSVTGRKYLRGPRGMGFLFVKNEVQDSLKVSYMDSFTADLVSTSEFKLRDDARRFELYEKSRALTLGLSKAVEYALAIGLDRIWQRIQYLAELLRHRLSIIKGVILHDHGSQKSGIITFTVDAVESLIIKDKLAEIGINVSVGNPASTMYFMSKHHLKSVVRASVHYYNTEQEITYLCKAICQITGDI